MKLNFNMIRTSILQSIKHDLYNIFYWVISSLICYIMRKNWHYHIYMFYIIPPTIYNHRLEFCMGSYVTDSNRYVTYAFVNCFHTVYDTSYGFQNIILKSNCNCFQLIQFIRLYTVIWKWHSVLCWVILIDRNVP